MQFSHDQNDNYKHRILKQHETSIRQLISWSDTCLDLCHLMNVTTKNRLSAFILDDDDLYRHLDLIRQRLEDVKASFTEELTYLAKEPTHDT